MVLTLRRFEIGSRDAYELASKLAAPIPETVRDWPEMRLDGVLQSPWSSSEVLLDARWPDHRHVRSVLLVHIGGGDGTTRRRLDEWCRTGASLSPMGDGPGRLRLR